MLTTVPAGTQKYICEFWFGPSACWFRGKWSLLLLFSSGSHGNWVVDWANTQQTGDQQFFLFLRAYYLIPASFLVTYQLPQHCFLPQSLQWLPQLITLLCMLLTFFIVSFYVCRGIFLLWLIYVFFYTSYSCPWSVLLWTDLQYISCPHHISLKIKLKKV